MAFNRLVFNSAPFLLSCFVSSPFRYFPFFQINVLSLCCLQFEVLTVISTLKCFWKCHENSCRVFFLGGGGTTLRNERFLNSCNFKFFLGCLVLSKSWEGSQQTSYSIVLTLGSLSNLRRAHLNSISCSIVYYHSGCRPSAWIKLLHKQAVY